MGRQPGLCLLRSPEMPSACDRACPWLTPAQACPEIRSHRRPRLCPVADAGMTLRGLCPRQPGREKEILL